MLPKLSWEYCSRWCLELHFVWNSSCCFNDMERTPWAIFSVIKVGMRAFQVALVVKNQPANAGDVRDTGSISVSGRSHGGGHGDSLQYSCLENHMDRGAWQAVAHRVSQSQTRLKHFSTHAYMHTGLEWGKGGKRTLLNHWVNSDLLKSLLLNPCNYVTIRAQFSSVAQLC